MNGETIKRLSRILALTREILPEAEQGSNIRSNLELIELYLEVMLDEIEPGFSQADIDMVMKNRKGSAA